MWHESLIPKLCRVHLIACWRESLGMYSIIINNKSGYRNHPATQEYIDCPELLHDRLTQVRNEMLKRGYHPKELPEKQSFGGKYKEWESLKIQTDKLKEKSRTIPSCQCLKVA